MAFPRRSLLGEGALWDTSEQRLFWIDIADQKVMSHDPARRSNTEWVTGQDVGTVVLTRGGSLLVALRNGLGVLDRSTGGLRLLVDPEADKSGNRFNDGKCDPRGRLWVGTMVEDGPPGDATLYCVDETLHVVPKITGVDLSNGLVWSRDGGTFYYIDTPTRAVRAYDFDVESAVLSRERVVATFDAAMGMPDGMAIDADDGLWVCMWGGRQVVRVDPTSGRVTFRVDVAANNVSSCAFGGEQLDTLYITTARVGQSSAELDADPDAGCLFAVQLPFRGVAAQRFQGEP